MGGVDNGFGWCVDGNGYIGGAFVADGCAVCKEMGCTARICNGVVRCVDGGRTSRLQKGMS